MAKYRPIFVEIWEDEDVFLNYTSDQKVIFFYLITNKNCTESGIYKISPRNISFTLNIKLQKVESIISNMQPNVYYDSATKHVFIKNFYKYNKSLGGRPDLKRNSLESDVKHFNTKLWSMFSKTYPTVEQLITTVQQLNNIDINIDNDICINDKNPDEKQKEIEPSWRTDFDIYVNEQKIIVRKLLDDADWMSLQKELNPKLNIGLTIKKAFTNFWATEEGWKNKKSRKGNINWKTTYQNALSQKLNKVYSDGI